MCFYWTMFTKTERSISNIVKLFFSLFTNLLTSYYITHIKLLLGGCNVAILTIHNSHTNAFIFFFQKFDTCLSECRIFTKMLWEMMRMLCVSTVHVCQWCNALCLVQWKWCTTAGPWRPREKTPKILYKKLCALHITHLLSYLLFGLVLSAAYLQFEAGTHYWAWLNIW